MEFLKNIYTNVQNWRLFITALAIALTGSFHFGYQILLTDPSEATFIAFMNSSMEALHPSDATIKPLWGLIIALFFIGSIVGSFFIRLTAELVGSRPASSRGFVNMMSGTILQLGTVFGSIIAMPEIFGSSNRWSLIYAFEMLPIFISITWMIFVYASPIQYLHKDDQENAKKSTIFYYGKSAAVNSLDEILLELNQQKSKAQQNKINFLAIFKSRENLRGCLVGCIVAMTVGFSGVTIIGVYCVEILTTSGLTPLQSSIATTLIMIISVIVFFVVGVLPISFFVTVEMVQPEFRSSAQMIATLVQMITRSIGMVVYVPLAGLLANWISYLILFFIPLFLAEVIFYFMLPETKGKDFDGVQKEISRLPLIKSLFKRAVKRKPTRFDDNEIGSESNDNKT
uniref:Major facilitator superfamily (MFS) profile domain-containing protein n=1 Tax=Acrobeloides nanus TaxID=290746 RepID=A0A914EH37_9BILA